jgi:hypothetical protein
MRRLPLLPLASDTARSYSAGVGVGDGVGETVGVGERLDPGDAVTLDVAAPDGVCDCVPVLVRDRVPVRVTVCVRVLVDEAPAEIDAV